MADALEAHWISFCQLAQGRKLSIMNLAAALEYQRRCAKPPTIVTVFPHRMERHFSTELFADSRAAVVSS